MQEWSEEQLKTAAELYGQVIGEGRTPKEALGRVMQFALGQPPAGGCEHRDARYGCPACVSAVRSRYPEFPLQKTRGPTGPTSVPWAVAEKAWAAYSTLYGRDQSVERMAERGGFTWGEMDELFPGWKDATDAWKKLEQERNVAVADLSAVVNAWRTGEPGVAVVLEGMCSTMPDHPGIALLERMELLAKALTFAGSKQGDGWHLNVCRNERRGMPGQCVDLCAQLRAAGLAPLPCRCCSASAHPTRGARGLCLGHALLFLLGPWATVEEFILARRAA
jgi:hypothetical protein